MIDIDKMPASLTGSREQQAGQYSNNFKNSIELLSADMMIGSNHSIAKQQISSSNISSNKFSTDGGELIDSKFNELAKKILDELKQAQYSRDFFQAIDEIIKEPIAKTFVRVNLKSSLNKYCNSRKATRQLQIQQQQHSTDTHLNEQPRSLPTQVNQLLSNSQINSRQPQQTLINQSALRQKQLIDQQAAQRLQNGTTIGVVRRNVTEIQMQSAPLNKSATTVEAPAFKRQPSVRKGSLSSAKAEEELNMRMSVGSPNEVPVHRRQSYSKNVTNNNNNNHLLNRTVGNYNEGDVDGDDDEDDFDDDDDDDDDDDEDDDDYDGNRRPNRQDVVQLSEQQHQQRFQQQQLYQQQQQQQQQLRSQQNNYINQRHPITKSKTLSDTTNISEISMLTKQQQQQPRTASQTQQSAMPGLALATTVAQQQQQQQLRQQQTSNQVVRSNTLSNARERIIKTEREPQVRDHLQVREQQVDQQQQQQQQQKFIGFNSKDIGSLYKPHMNYSTSVLGNHRLSDDDEIIIIPTQSPSLISNSPDPDANLDELSERFSISRTKSFWEKLSKGSPGKRSSTTPSGERVSMKANHQQFTANKVLGARSGNGHHSHTLDRMDSTGGSNSNYSCSSSGDENGGAVGGSAAGGGGSQACQNPTIKQLQDMSRQNRFRQTR